MNTNQLKLRLELELDPEWASNQNEEEVVEFIRDKLSNSLGFRATVKGCKVARRKVRTG